jgi:RecA-family ATPase
MATGTESGAEDDDDYPFLIDWSEVHDPDDDIVDGLALPGRWTQFIAGAKVGKSSLTMFIAIELSEGRDPFDGTPIDPVVVLYCDGEMGRRDLEKLIRD